MSNSRQLNKLTSMDVHLRNIELLLRKVQDSQGGAFDKIVRALEKVVSLKPCVESKEKKT